MMDYVFPSEAIRKLSVFNSTLILINYLRLHEICKSPHQKNSSQKQPTGKIIWDLQNEDNYNFESTLGSHQSTSFGIFLVYVVMIPLLILSLKFKP
jgi:hypothetical protein